MTSGLGIDFDPPLDHSASKDTENFLPQNATLKSARRRAHVRGRSHFGKGDNTSKAHTQAQIPSMPLRENHSMVNASLQPSPVYMMKHPLPAKPMVDWSVMQDVQPVPARLRVETPSDTSTSPQSMLVSNPVSLNVPQPMAPVPMHTSSSSPYLHVEDPCSAPLTPLQISMNDMAIHELPAKPQSTPMLPPERDERVGIDVFMENDLCVEGSTLHGYIRLVLPNHTDPSTAMLLAQPRVRLIGFETLPDEDIRHIFYRHMSVIDGDRSNDGPSEPYVLHGSPAMSQADGTGQSLLPCFASLPDNDGYYLGQAGEHVLPFSLQVPMDKGAKGSYQSSSAEVGYIIIASVRVKAFGEKQGGVAHCFQKLQLYPYLNPTAVLASASRPIVAHANSAEADARCIQLAASLHRETWVAGQRVYFDVSVLNNGENMLNMLRIALVRVENVYHTRSTIPASPPDLNSSSSIIVDETLTAGNSQHWWTGAPSGSPVYFSHSFQLPDNIISMERSRHVEVQYMLRIGVGADASTLVEVDLPLHVINYVSLDPPPPRRTYMNAAGLLGHPSHSLPDQQQMIERLRTLDAMRSPRDKHNSSLLTPDSAQPVAVRTAQHKRSLDFINSAIRSATARHTSPFVSSSMSPAGLGIELGSNVSASITSTPPDNVMPVVSEQTHVVSQAVSLPTTPPTGVPPAKPMGTLGQIPENQPKTTILPSSSMALNLALEQPSSDSWQGDKNGQVMTPNPLSNNDPLDNSNSNLLDSTDDGWESFTMMDRAAATTELSPDLRVIYDKVFLEYLNSLCSNLEAKDERGELIHQTLMPKKMARLDESPDFRPFKFRIQAFTNAFQTELQRNGLSEEDSSLRKIKPYLWTHPYISRFNEDGKKAKSKGNHIWNVEARRLPGGGWEFFTFTPKITAATSKVAYVGEQWSWTLRIWDPQASSTNIKVVYTANTMPKWLHWEEDEKVLTGVPSSPSESGEVSVTALYHLCLRWE
ncbi:hypothetical protein MEQU1_002363 [Malassezia equina]|uniref:Arrestin C-terminal-like domain-containing protein n=1 Tax=Malassezia equina TaxID=1381935 RepID=A0AAF0EEU8_9BASI|nr:hypothetical protein MEQU1_002363 [Malassezia equina]